jgi:chromosome segregation ATPase
MLSSKNESKQEARFAARLDVLTERVDTLASTVATTASAMAKKEGEIAALRKELAVRDEQLADYVTKARGASGGDELRELREAVAALSTAGSSKRGDSKQVDELTAKLNLLGQRLDTLSTTVSTTAAGLAGREGEIAALRKRLEAGAGEVGERAIGVDPELRNQLAGISAIATRLEARLDAQDARLAGLEADLADRSVAPAPPSDELRSMLAMLRTRVESLDALRAGVTEEVLTARLSESAAEARDALAQLSERLDRVEADAEAATTRLGEREHELGDLHRQLADSSTRIETIVVDLREALGALEETDPDAVATLTTRVESALRDAASLASRVERLEAAQDTAEVTRLGDRIEAVEERLAGVSVEIARAKTLWPVALRSLEARLDDAVAPHASSEEPEEHPQSAPEPRPDDPADDLLAELRDSLQVMESVAAEIERVSDGTPDDEVPEAEAQQAVVGGARIVPLRTTDP